MKVKELLSDESKWTKDALARDKYFKIVPTKDENAVCWCLMGAIMKCYTVSLFNSSNYFKIMGKVQKKLGKTSMGTWNDKIATFQDVKNLVEELDI